MGWDGMGYPILTGWSGGANVDSLMSAVFAGGL